MSHYRGRDRVKSTTTTEVELLEGAAAGIITALRAAGVRVELGGAK